MNFLRLFEKFGVVKTTFFICPEVIQCDLFLENSRIFQYSFQSLKIFWAVLSKLHSTCPEEHFESCFLDFQI